tara:strand:+ start:17 stop:685 length:669 start_codon:yes stop_codon:yes gene_type:complete
MKNVKQLLPKGSKELIKKALTLYKNSIEIINHDSNGEMIDDDINYDHFDCIGLIGMMNYDVEVILPNESKEYFSGKHNVDFPMFEEVKRMYPIKEESEWVTIIKGDFSFVDDEVHGRECYVNSIVSIEKHLRYDMGQVIDDIENDGGGYVVVEDYDGNIEMNFLRRSKREFLVIDSMVESVRRQTYTEMKQTDGDIMDVIDALEVGKSYERHENEIYYIRVK